MITSKQQGSFRFLGKSCAVTSDLNLSALMSVDELIREHPYFQRLGNKVTIFFAHTTSFSGLLSSEALVGRMVVGSPLSSVETQGFVLADGDPFLVVEERIESFHKLTLQDIYSNYSRLHEEVADFDYGPFWSLAFDELEPNYAVLQFLPNNQKLFSQFVDN